MKFHYTIDPKPLQPSNDITSQRFKVTAIWLAVKKGIEIQVGDDGIVDPNSDCWFAIVIEYPDDTTDDVLITNGDDYHLVRRSRGKSPLILNGLCRHRIKRAISNFLKSLLSNEDVHPEHWRQD